MAAQFLEDSVTSLYLLGFLLGASLCSINVFGKYLARICSIDAEKNFLLSNSKVTTVRFMQEFMNWVISIIKVYVTLLLAI